MSSRFFRSGLVLAAALAAIAAFMAATATAGRSASETLSGAGSTFITPIMSQWQKDYPPKTGVNINYGGGGSGAGVTAITNKTVDFGASDAPLTPDQFKACSDCVQIPWVLSATSIIYNVKGVKNNLHMTGNVLSRIYLGQITKWNDPAIQRLNKGASLPDEDIKPVYRSGASGTSYNLTDYLASVSPGFKSAIGITTTPAFKIGQGASGSSGMAGAVSRTEGGLGYVDVAFALANKLKFFYVQNKAGKFAGPGLRGIKAAASTVKKVPPGNELSIVNPPKSQTAAYPICTFSYVIVHKGASKAAALRRFIFYALTIGQTFGPKLLFVPIPVPVLVAAEKTLKTVTG